METFHTYIIESLALCILVIRILYCEHLVQMYEFLYIHIRTYLILYKIFLTYSLLYSLAADT
jgi:hypothetical protein